MTRYDLIVVGGGPAGSTAARHAAKAGLEVLLVEREALPRYKACAGAIRADVLDLLDFDVSGVLHRKINGFSIFSPSGLRADCMLEERSRPGYTVMRDEFDQLLFEKAKEAGANAVDGTEVGSARQNAEGTEIETKNGEKFQGEFLIGADGINSTVAKSLGFYRGWSGDSAGVALEIEAEVEAKKIREVCGDPGGYDADLFFMYFGHVPHGYTWCFPKRTVLSLGAWCRQDRLTNLREAYDRWFSEFCREYDLKPRIISDTAARFPVSVHEKLVDGRTILIGDAGGLVDPFTGEGIPYAIESGEIAAAAVKRAHEQSDLGQLRLFTERCQQRLISRIEVAESIANMLYKSKKNMEIFGRFLSEDKYASDLVAALVGGLIEPNVAKRKLTLRLLRKRPLDAIRLLL